MVPACETFNGFCILGVKNVKIEDGVSDGLARVNRDRNPELHISNHEVMHLMTYHKPPAEPFSVHPFGTMGSPHWGRFDIRECMSLCMLLVVNEL